MTKTPVVIYPLECLLPARLVVPVRTAQLYTCTNGDSPSLDGKASGEGGLETFAPSVGIFVFIAFTSLEPEEEGGAGGEGASAVAAVVVVVFRPLAVLSPNPEDDPEDDPEDEPEDEPGNEPGDEPEDGPEDVIAFTSLDEPGNEL